MILFILYFCTLDNAIALNRAKDYQNSEMMMVWVDSDKLKPPAYAQYLFYRMVNNYFLNNKKKVLFYGDKMEAILSDDIPQRYKVVASLMYGDVRYWDKGLGDIARDMRRSKHRLDLTKPDQETQKIQKSIVDRLDKMIKKMEDKHKQSSAVSSSQQPPAQPAQESYLPQMPEVEGKVRHARIRRLTKEWGRLPERERRRLLFDLTRGLTPTHREAVENYFRRLAN